MQKIKQLVLSSRPVSWVNTAYPFGATYLVLTGRADLTFVLGCLFFLIPYNLLMYGINDVFDYESDLRNPRKKGAEGIVLQPALHRLTLISAIASCLPFIITLMLLTGTGARWTLLAIIFGVVAYSAPGLRFKEKPFLDSVTSSLHFVGPMIFAIVASGQSIRTTLPFVAAFFLWGLASHAFGAVQDIKADRAGGIGSVATVIGARQTVWFSLACYGLSIILVASQASWQTSVIALSLTPYILNALPYYTVSEADAPRTNTAWRRFIYLNFFTGMVITMVLIADTL